MTYETEEKPLTRREFELWQSYHERVHRIHSDAHTREHEQTGNALEKSELALDKRLEGMNEFREQLKDQASLFITKDALENKFNALNDKIDVLGKEHNIFLTTERYEQTHKFLVDKIETKFGTYDDKILAEQKVTVRQDATQAVLDKLATNNRWLVGVAISTALSLVTLVAHLFGIF